LPLLRLWRLADAISAATSGRQLVNAGISRTSVGRPHCRGLCLPREVVLSTPAWCFELSNIFLLGRAAPKQHGLYFSPLSTIACFERALNVVERAWTLSIARAMIAEP